MSGAVGDRTGLLDLPAGDFLDVHARDARALAARRDRRRRRLRLQHGRRPPREDSAARCCHHRRRRRDRRQLDHRPRRVPARRRSARARRSTTSCRSPTTSSSAGIADRRPGRHRRAARRSATTSSSAARRASPATSRSATTPRSAARPASRATRSPGRRSGAHPPCRCSRRRGLPRSRSASRSSSEGWGRSRKRSVWEKTLPPERAHVTILRQSMDSNLKIFSGNSNRTLSEAICEAINTKLGDATVTTFPDGESFVKINENIRGKDVFIIQSTCPPTNHHLDGAAHHDRRRAPRVGRAHHRRAAVLRLRAPGSQGPAARADHREARRQSPRRRRRDPRAHDGPAQPADPGVLRHPGRSSLRIARSSSSTSRRRSRRTSSSSSRPMSAA